MSYVLLYSYNLKGNINSVKLIGNEYNKQNLLSNILFRKKLLKLLVNLIHISQLKILKPDHRNKVYLLRQRLDKHNKSVHLDFHRSAIFTIIHIFKFKCIFFALPQTYSYKMSFFYWLNIKNIFNFKQHPRCYFGIIILIFLFYFFSTYYMST